MDMFTEYVRILSFRLLILQLKPIIFHGTNLILYSIFMLNLGQNKVFFNGKNINSYSKMWN